MNPVELILKKRNGHTLTDSEIRHFITSYLSGHIPDYQMSAFLMACWFQGLMEEEVIALTSAFIDSGKRLVFPETLLTADKHSTGGIGDKISLMLAPIAASLGLTVPMISGRGLGHTGGTLDKLESIPGFQTQYSMQDFRDLVIRHGIALVGQSAELVPADKRIYALRDVTATVENTGLITASIMSKKIAEGAKHLVIDLKVGSGAFMPTLKHAKELAKYLIKTGKAFGQKVTVVFTDMNAPLGTHIGNALEVVEAIAYLKGNYQFDTQVITEKLVSEMLLSAGIVQDKQAAVLQIRESVNSGKALAKFREMITAQNGDAEVCDHPEKLPQAKYQIPVIAQCDGYVSKIDSRNIGYALITLGAGRQAVTDSIDYSAGAVLYPKIGTYIHKGDLLGIIYANNETKAKSIISRIIASYQMTTEQVPAQDIILAEMTEKDIDKK